jgi:hypothetical protein
MLRRTTKGLNAMYQTQGYPIDSRLGAAYRGPRRTGRLRRLAALLRRG